MEWAVTKGFRFVRNPYRSVTSLTWSADKSILKITQGNISFLKCLGAGCLYFALVTSRADDSTWFLEGWVGLYRSNSAYCIRVKFATDLPKYHWSLQSSIILPHTLGKISFPTAVKAANGSIDWENKFCLVKRGEKTRCPPWPDSQDILVPKEDYTCSHLRFVW